MVAESRAPGIDAYCGKEIGLEQEEIREECNGNIVFNIDVMLAKRKMSVGELANRVGITLANMSILKTGKAKAIKVSTLAKLCETLDCQPGDLLAYEKKDK